MAKNIVKNLGKVLVGTRSVLKIPVIEPVPQNFSILKSCDCIKATLDRKNKVLTIIMTASPIPRHLIQKGKFEYIVSRSAEIISPSNPNFKPVKVIVNMTVYENRL
jgi:hypothetical protein